MNAILRQAAQNGARVCLAASAIDARSLRPLLERAGEILAYDLTHKPIIEQRAGSSTAEGLGTKLSERVVPISQ
jgi:hypothetical protein